MTNETQAVPPRKRQLGSCSGPNNSGSLGSPTSTSVLSGQIKFLCFPIHQQEATDIHFIFSGERKYVKTHNSPLVNVLICSPSLFFFPHLTSPCIVDTTRGTLCQPVQTSPRLAGRPQTRQETVCLGFLICKVGIRVLLTGLLLRIYKDELMHLKYLKQFLMQNKHSTNARYYEL